MTCKAEVLADSLHPETGSRLTTMRITYPRFIHAEFMTHRMFARNAASSRAIPSSRMRDGIRKDPALPLSWGENKAGMQQGADVAPYKRFLGKFLWLGLMHLALLTSAVLDRLGLHKQIVNRVTEPWSHITVVVTGTDEAYANFYALRCHPAAEPTIHLLADVMREKHKASRPRGLGMGQWHVPLVTDAERFEGPDSDALRMSVARVARTSYNKPDGNKPSLSDDLMLHDRLVASEPKHASPAEHQAQAVKAPNKGGCFGFHTGWLQYRHTLTNESCKELRL